MAEEGSRETLLGWGQVIAGYGAFAYAVGYAVSFLNGARLGFLPPELPQARVVWGGLVPIAIMLAGIWLSLKAQRAWPGGQVLSVVEVATDMLKAGVFTLLFLGLSPSLLYQELFWLMKYEGDTAAAKWIKEHVTWLTTGVVIFLILYFVIGSWAVFRRLQKSNPAELLRKFLITPLIVVLLILYLFRVFPALPMRYGFGGPSRVKLLVGTDYAGLLPGTTAGVALEAAGLAKEKVRMTAPVELLMKTEKEYVVRVAGGRVVTVGAEAVKAVEWLP